MFNTLRSRLLLSYFLVAFVCLSVTACLILILAGPLQRQLTYSRLLDRAIPTTLWVQELLRRNVPPSEIIQRADIQLEQQQLRMFLVNREGLVLADSDNELVGQTVPSFNLRDIAPTQWPARGQWKPPGGQAAYYLSLPATNLRAMRQPLPENTVFVVLATRSQHRILLEASPFLAIAIAVGFVVSVLLSLLITRWIAWPLGQVIHAAEEVAGGNYDQRLEIASPDEMKRLADSFNYMAKQVKAAQDSQRDFVANVSHELKTPLTSIQGFAQAILDGTVRDSEGQRHAAQIITEETQRMTRLVEDLLALAKVAADRDHSTWTEVNIPALLNSCVQKLVILAGEKELNFDLDLSPVSHVRGNPDRLAQVFTNLLDNAIKHSTQKGVIRVSTRMATDTSPNRGKRQIEISIADSGPGIPPEDLSRIFERFYQVDKSRASRKGSAGLGLAIAHEIVEMHDGQIWADNQPSSGAIFTVRLPEV